MSQEVRGYSFTWTNTPRRMDRRHHMYHFPWSSLHMLLLALFLVFSDFVVAQPANIQYSDCFSGNDSLKLQISDVYAQLVPGGPLGTHLNFTLIGQTPQPIINAPPLTSNGSIPANESGAASESTTRLGYSIARPLTFRAQQPYSRPPIF